MKKEKPERGREAVVMRKAETEINRQNGKTLRWKRKRSCGGNERERWEKRMDGGGKGGID